MQIWVKIPPASQSPLKALAAKIGRARPMLEAGAKAVQVHLSKHLRRLQARGNRHGWPPRKFFAGRADSVEKRVGVASITDTKAVVTVADLRFVHYLKGGTVRPKRARMLAIPLTAEAYALGGQGTLRESAPGLEVRKFAKGLYLGRPSKEKVKRQVGVGPRGGKKFEQAERERFVILFRLVRSVTHKAHPADEPKPDELGAVAAKAMQRAGELLLRAAAKP